MKSRYVVLCLTLVLALALAVPALGGPTNPIASLSASVKKTANKALKKANAAQTTANDALNSAASAQSNADAAGKAAKTAQTTATTAQTTATTALNDAKTAQTTANGAKATADAAKTAAAAAQATADSKFGQTITEFGSGSGTETTSGQDFVTCPAGSEVTGGGFIVNGAGADEVVPFFDSSYGDAWLTALNRIPGGTGSWSVQATVVCAKP